MSCCEKIVEAASTATPCECEESGFCARHQCHKVAHFHHLCRSNIGYFEQYEKGIGPGQNLKPPPLTIGIGDVVAFLIRVLTFGLVKMCRSCQGRKAWLNRIRLWPLWRRK